MNRLVGVGVGPGDPELVTVKGVRALREADLVLVPVMTPTEEGRAESVVRVYTDRLERVVFALNDRGGVTERRTNAWDAAAARVRAAFAEGATTVAFATIGDPNVYSTFTYLAQTARESGAVTETVPGITAMQDLAARSGTVLTEGAESLRLMSLTGGVRPFAEALPTGDTVVAYKFGQVATDVLTALKDTDRLDDAVYGARLGLPGERIGPATQIEGPVPYLATLIVPARRTSREESCDHRKGDLRRGRSRRRGSADVPRRHGDRLGRRRHLGGQPGARGRPPARPPGRRDRRLRTAGHGGRAALLRAGREGRARGGAGSTPATPACGAPCRNSSTVARSSAWRPRSSPASPASARSRRRCDRELTIPEVAQSVILTRLGGGKTPMPPGEEVSEFARHGTTMALFLSAARSRQLAEELLGRRLPAGDALRRRLPVHLARRADRALPARRARGDGEGAQALEAHAGPGRPRARRPAAPARTSTTPAISTATGARNGPRGERSRDHEHRTA